MKKYKNSKLEISIHILKWRLLYNPWVNFLIAVCIMEIQEKVNIGTA